jgi:glucosyl-3-phosphoglycerate synthase
MNGMDRRGFERARAFFDRLPQPHEVIWNDGDGMACLYEEVRAAGSGDPRAGKGCNVWAGCALALARGAAGVIAVHDSDILDYGRGQLARLCLPVLHPQMGYAFSKGYYGRVSDRMNGRVMRLLLTPLLQAFHDVCGALPSLEFIAGFRYPLAGEFAVGVDLAGQLAMPSGWGLEVGMLGEVHRRLDSDHAVCQVPLGGNFRHKHRDLELDSGVGEGLTVMAEEIVSCLLEEARRAGIALGQDLVQGLTEAFGSVALELGKTYRHDAMFNGLQFDQNAEDRAVQVFAGVVSKVLSRAVDGDGVEAPLQSWNSVVERSPEIASTLVQVVASDNS